MNEGVLPSSDHTQSFIPSEFADCFNLPNWKNQHSSDAYIFWRCLQQAHSISLMYSCYDNTGKALSPSRFISQVQYEWPYRNSNVLVSFEDIEIESNDGFTVEPTVVGSELNTDIVRNRISEKGLSATALNSWLNCNRKFYYRYLMGINELESLEFVIDGREEGNWLHLIMCFLYENDLNEVLDFSKIDRILSDVEFQSEKVFFKEFGHNQSHSHGDAVLIKEQIKRRIYEIIQCDRLSVPFQINAVEKEICISIEENGMIYKLCATFDRIEKINDKLCIIDYKTGSIDGFKLPGKLKNLCDDNNLPIIHALFDTSQRRDQKYFDYLTQAFLYILIYWKSSGCIEIPSFSWIAFERDKDMNRKSIDELLHCPISEVDLIAFESLLSNEILLMLSENSNFKLTENADTCKMCDYKSVCIKDLDGGITF